MCHYHVHSPNAEEEANKTFISSLHLSNGIKIQVHVCLTLNSILFIHSFTIHLLRLFIVFALISMSFLNRIDIY